MYHGFLMGMAIVTPTVTDVLQRALAEEGHQ